VARQFVDGPDDNMRYFCFSVTHSAGSIALDEWEHMDQLTTHTEAYLKDAEVSRAVDRLVSLLCALRCAAEWGAAVTLNHICKSAVAGRITFSPLLILLVLFGSVGYVYTDEYFPIEEFSFRLTHVC
jgi:ammonia channel protein AmtB